MIALKSIPFYFNFSFSTIEIVVSHMTELAVLEHLHLKTFKIPDEKERYEPQVFRDAIIAGLEDVGNNHDQLLKYLCDTATGKLDVKRLVGCQIFITCHGNI